MMMHERPTMAEVLRKTIRTSGVSVNALAKKVGLAQPTLCLFVNGRRGISMRSAERLATHFGLELVERPRKERGR
jgi:plasmid maintenance system antidote protein VapI